MAKIAFRQPLRSALFTCAALSGVTLAACSQGGNQTAQAPPPTSAPAAKPKAPVEPAKQAEGADPTAQAAADQINKALYAAPAPATASGGAPNTTSAAAPPAGASAPVPMLIKAEVLLARANFSPGVIDGQDGQNLQDAVNAYAQSNGLKTAGQITPEVWARLNAPGAQPVAGAYTITAEDVAGPFYPNVGEDLWKASKLKHTGYSTPLEMLAERFHTSQALLQSLNPGIDFTKAGAIIVTPQVGDVTLAPVDHVEVDKASEGVRAYDAQNKLLAFFPATVGSTDRPSPSGTHKVKGVARDPTYVYDPKKLTWGPKKRGRFTVPSGPNNPVGSVWIALDAPDYGMHGSPNPKLIGKTASHGCVRMTNWDALLLASGVKPGVVVHFVSGEGAKSSA